MMEKLAVTSCQVYRQIVREEPRFVPYFRTATPELELAGLNVGSRPAKRNPKGLNILGHFMCLSLLCDTHGDSTCEGCAFCQCAYQPSTL